MFGECHAHLLMDGVNYKKAVQLHREGVCEADVRRKLEQYAERGITYIRDGGDTHGVSLKAKELAPEYGITYRTCAFAIHKKGHYGGIVGYAFEDWKEYRDLVREAKRQGADFIKVMFSGILDFANCGELSEPPIDAEEIRQMTEIAKEEGCAVMAHVNGAQAVKAAVASGVDSVEHGNFMDEEALQMLAESDTVWVPTYVTLANLIGGGRFDDAAVGTLVQEQGERIRRGFELGVSIALGSDGGAWRVLHGEGLVREYELMKQLMTGEQMENDSFVLSEKELDMRLQQAEEKIRKSFKIKKILLRKY